MPKKTRILIVEDDDMLRSALSRWVIKNKAIALEAVSAEEALELPEMPTADLAIVDIRLPGMDGLTLAEKLIAAEKERPVLLITAYADLEGARQAMNLGVYEYITKPFELEDLGASIQRALQHRSLLLEKKAHNEKLEEEVAQRTRELHREIEERKKAEQALRNSEAQLRLITDSLPVFFSHVDADECYLFVNKKYEETFDISREKVYGQHISTVVGKPSYQRLRPFIDRVLAGETVEFEVPLPTDSEKICSATYVPHIDANGIVLGFFALIVDITERKQMESRIVQLERLGALSEMSEGVSHNLNNILTGILGPAQLIELYTDNRDVLREATMIQEAAIKATDLVKRLSTAVGSESVTPVGVDVVATIQQAISIAQPRWKDEAEAQGITIEIVTDLPPLPPVQATPKGLHTVFLNLIFNALDAMPEGGTLSISARRIHDDIQITVADTGVGMDEEVRRRVFEPFFTTKANVGTGLGLSTVFTSVSRWNGQIDLKSTPGEGTTAIVHLPLWQEKQTDGPPETHRTGSVLIVEDEDMVRNFLYRALKQYHHVEVAENGFKAQELFSADAYDVVLIDLGMPEMPGDQVAEQLRKIDPHIATVLITGWDLSDDDPRRTVFDFYLHKPFDTVDKILNIVASAIRTRDARINSV